MNTQIYCIEDHRGPGAPGARSLERVPGRKSGGIPQLEPRGSPDREHLIAELKARDAEVEQFIRTVSHDLKSPLVTIKGFLALLKRDAATGDRELLADDIRHIGRAADRLHQLLDTLFEYHRIGRQANAPESVPLGALARQALDLVLEEVDDSGLKIFLALDLPLVTGDALRLLEVFRHLLGNAVKFMGDQPSPRIEVGVRMDGGEAVCFVRDNGMGIDPGDHERIFELFTRLDSYVRGTGSGLALVRRIVEVHGGRIWVESEGQGRGAVFCFTLPCDSSAAEEAV